MREIAVLHRLLADFNVDGLFEDPQLLVMVVLVKSLWEEDLAHVVELRGLSHGRYPPVGVVMRKCCDLLLLPFQLIHHLSLRISQQLQFLPQKKRL